MRDIFLSLYQSETPIVEFVESYGHHCSHAFSDVVIWLNMDQSSQYRNGSIFMLEGKILSILSIPRNPYKINERVALRIFRAPKWHQYFMVIFPEHIALPSK